MLKFSPDYLTLQVGFATRYGCLQAPIIMKDDTSTANYSTT